MSIYWVVGFLLFLLTLYIFVDREIYFYEGTHLGPRIQGWLYDRWAKKYDQGKQASQARDAEMLARPLVTALREAPAPLVLDLATGTGRLPLALLREPDFGGHIVALDISLGMLEQAAVKLADYKTGVTLIRQSGWPLPFPDETFDIVCCLEALEVMPEMETPLAELFRTLRPGGLLVTSRGTEASGRRAKVISAPDFVRLLERTGFTQVEVTPWWKLFDRVLARKPGTLTPAGRPRLSEVLLCPACKEPSLIETADALRCQRCGRKLPRTPEGILLL
ncbi:MAG: methyltransferase domain-containing protein [Anaerolineales bacterium]